MNWQLTTIIVAVIAAGTAITLAGHGGALVSLIVGLFLIVWSLS